MKEPFSEEHASRMDVYVCSETALLAVINVVAFFGNLLTCYAVYRNHSLRTLPNMFVIALGVSDILMSIFCMPLSVVTLFRGRWMFGENFCRFVGFGALTFGFASLQTIGLIAVSRYFCVVKPEKYAVLFKKQRALLYIGAVWCVALVGSLPPFFMRNAGFEFQRGKAMCLYTFERNIPYSIFLGLVYIAAPLIVIKICYAKVFCSVSRSNRVFSLQNNLQRLRAYVEETKVTESLAAVMVGFICCWLPIGLMDYIDVAQGKPTFPRQAYLAYGFLIYPSSTINPFIYGGTNKKFRREYKGILSKVICFRRKNDYQN